MTTYGPVRVDGRRANVEVLEDGLVVRRDRSGLADLETLAAVAFLVLLVAGFALFRVNEVLGWVVLVPALVPPLLLALAHVVGTVFGVAALATRRGRRGAGRELRRFGRLFRDRRTVADSLEVLPEHLIVVPRPVTLHPAPDGSTTLTGPRVQVGVRAMRLHGGQHRRLVADLSGSR